MCTYMYHALVRGIPPTTCSKYHNGNNQLSAHSHTSYQHTPTFLGYRYTKNQEVLPEEAPFKKRDQKFLAKLVHTTQWPHNRPLYAYLHKPSAELQLQHQVWGKYASPPKLGKGGTRWGKRVVKRRDTIHCTHVYCVLSLTSFVMGAHKAILKCPPQDKGRKNMVASVYLTTVRHDI